mmetsp:Transcript_9866/g.29553  ORF Transcript_9866/g.29553 Transcript_9866/m.29553 type:complete len:233 (+) Transcript_9866:940-1638(+)
MDQERETQTVRPVASSARESAATNRALSPCHSLPGETASSLSRSARSSAENWCATLRTYAAAHGLLQLRANAFPNLFAGRRGRAAAAAAVQPGESRTGEAARTAAFGRPGLRYSPSFCPRECSVSASRRIPSGKRVALCVHLLSTDTCDHCSSPCSAARAFPRFPEIYTPSVQIDVVRRVGRPERVYVHLRGRPDPLPLSSHRRRAEERASVVKAVRLGVSWTHWRYGTHWR